jgi:hypothetical protein
MCVTTKAELSSEPTLSLNSRSDVRDAESTRKPEISAGHCHPFTTPDASGGRFEMNEFGMYPSNTDAVRRWMAERENASARLELARTRECCSLLISQHDPVFSMGIDRDALKILLGFIAHHDTHRLRRECEAHIGSKSA